MIAKSAVRKPPPGPANPETSRHHRARPTVSCLVAREPIGNSDPTGPMHSPMPRAVLRRRCRMRNLGCAPYHRDNPRHRRMISASPASAPFSSRSASLARSNSREGPSPPPSFRGTPVPASISIPATRVPNSSSLSEHGPASGGAGHTRALRSLDAETSQCPSGLKATDSTWAPWVMVRPNGLPVPASKRRITPSSQAVAIHRPSGLNAMSFTLPPCNRFPPMRRARVRPARRSRVLAIPVRRPGRAAYAAHPSQDARDDPTALSSDAPAATGASTSAGRLGFPPRKTGGPSPSSISRRPTRSRARSRPPGK